MGVDAPGPALRVNACSASAAGSRSELVFVRGRCAFSEFLPFCVLCSCLPRVARPGRRARGSAMKQERTFGGLFRSGGGGSVEELANFLGVGRRPWAGHRRHLATKASIPCVSSRSHSSHSGQGHRSVSAMTW